MVSSALCRIDMPEWLQLEEEQARKTPFPDDEEKLRYVIQLAQKNVSRGGGPFAAAVFEERTNRLLGIGVNLVLQAKQFWAHAEMTAMGHAQNILGKETLAGCSLVSSCEPCAMCLGALPWSGVTKLVYGAPREMPESVGFDEGDKPEGWQKLLRTKGIAVVGPLLLEAAFAPLADYRKRNGVIY